MSGPIFPSLVPKVSDSLWFSVDKPCDDENELVALEEEHQNWLRAIAEKGKNIVPIGKSAAESLGEDDDEDDEDDADVDDETDTNDDDDDLGTDMIDDRDSPDEVDMDGNDPNSDSPAWGL